ncbi:glycosyltransferase family 9 protein [Desulfovibrio sp. 86]|uniref:Putative Heptosyltransferase n=1 Tax=uncultured Desulfovibrio sp. TaxID=167968 RepID=A0A212L7E9_9BACT|nr:glycosyltransferase family 9 protein [Desulfovibrio sp. 86]SCM73503.1 putative Heptosyltransferase [uncultured Desulfovibrio sp.]VZH34236.1 putative Heptosyltransferase [Desulfovibrio sp. 86]
MAAYLIIKLGALGDVVMASAMLTELKIRQSGNTVTWITGKAARPLLEMTNLVDEIITVDEQAILNGCLKKKMSSVISVFFKLLGRRFDVCLVPYRDWRYHLLRLGARCASVRSFRGSRWLIPGRYHVFEYMRLASGRECFAGGEAVIPQVSFPQKVQAPQVLLAPGCPTQAATDILRQWPLEHYVHLARRLCESGYSVGLIGMDATGLLEETFKGIPVTSYINKTKLEGLLCLLASAELLVAHDSGPIHLMKVAGGTCVSLFGPTLASEKIWPSPRHSALQSPVTLPCMPCYDGKNYAACVDRFCMKQIQPEAVFIAVQKHLSGNFSYAKNTREEA